VLLDAILKVVYIIEMLLVDVSDDECEHDSDPSQVFAIACHESSNPDSGDRWEESLSDPVA
jgi:hypothetical protein